MTKGYYFKAVYPFVNPAEVDSSDRHGRSEDRSDQFLLPVDHPVPASDSLVERDVHVAYASSAVN